MAKTELEKHGGALHHVCELMDYYKERLGKSDFAELIGDYKYAALVAMQTEIFSSIRTLECVNKSE